MRLCKMTSTRVGNPCESASGTYHPSMPYMTINTGKYYKPTGYNFVLVGSNLTLLMGVANMVDRIDNLFSETKGSSTVVMDVAL